MFGSLLCSCSEITLSLGTNKLVDGRFGRWIRIVRGGHWDNLGFAVCDSPHQTIRPWWGIKLGEVAKNVYLDFKVVVDVAWPTVGIWTNGYPSRQLSLEMST